MNNLNNAKSKIIKLGLATVRIGLAQGGVCAKFRVVCGQSGVVCLEWSPILTYTRRQNWQWFSPFFGNYQLLVFWTFEWMGFLPFSDADLSFKILETTGAARSGAAVAGYGAVKSGFLALLLRPPCSLAAPQCSGAPSVRPLAPSVLPLKRPCSLSRSKRVISEPKFGVYI